MHRQYNGFSKKEKYRQYNGFSKKEKDRQYNGFSKKEKKHRQYNGFSKNTSNNLRVTIERHVTFEDNVEQMVSL